MRVVLVAAALALVALVSAEDTVYTNDFAVEIDGDKTVADLVAGVHGLRIKRQLMGLGNIYVFTHPQVRGRQKRSADDVVVRLQKDPNVKFVEQQKLLKREKRGFLRDSYNEVLRREQRAQDSAADDALVEEVAAEVLDMAHRNIIYDKQRNLPIHVYKDKSIYQRFNPENKRLQSRQFSERNSKCHVFFKDPNYHDQWYLNNRGQSGGPVGYDVNVQCAWKMGFTGKGVVVTILDDGLDHTHPDLIKNYDPEASTNMNDLSGKSHDPQPDLKNPSNTHGTRCAGEVAAEANNTVCGVGIAYNSRIGGVRILDGPVTDTLEAAALGFNSNYIDIYSASWGPPDNGKTMQGPGKYCSQALKNGAEKGRHGKGSIFVWATGNGGLYMDTCSCDGYASSIYTLSIGCVSDEGLSTYFSEICPSTMAVIFTGGAHEIPAMTRRSHARRPRIKVVTTDPLLGCVLGFEGTSSAAPLAAGCFALVLEANPNLTWRDMQHITVNTARIPNPNESGWMMNGAGRHHNAKFGFGVIDCGKMVEVAQGWVTVPKQHVCAIKPTTLVRLIPFDGSLTVPLRTTGCHDDPARRIRHVEHVEVHVKLVAARRGDVNLVLFSPHMTRSEILRHRPLDNATSIDFTFMTVFNWGEDPHGKWLLVIRDTSFENSAGAGPSAGPSAGSKGSAGKHRPGSAIRLLSFGMTLYGTATSPKDAHAHAPVLAGHPVDQTQNAHKLNKLDLQHELLVEEGLSDNLQIRNARESQQNLAAGGEERGKEINDNEINEFIDALGEMLRED